MKKSILKFNTVEFDKVIKIRSNHFIRFELEQNFTVDGRKCTIKNVLHDNKKTYYVFLKLKKE